MSVNNLQYTVDTARAILGASYLFKNSHTVVWEYVVNEIQYRDKKTKPQVFVIFEKDKIIIKGNGSGMDLKGLKNFFTLHGENQERKGGNPGRGKHGTGKAAAFSIANSLLISTIKDKKLYEIKLSKKELKKYEGSGKNIPLGEYVLTNGKKVNEANGTTIEISEFNIKPNRKEIIEYIEKHIATYKSAEVWVDNHSCQYKEPASKSKHIYNTSKTHPELGNIDLVLKVSEAPLDKSDLGIKILSNSTWQEQTLCGAEGKDMSEYIFGEIDCPKLDDDNQEIAATTMARDMSLNQNNPIVKSLFSFAGFHIEELRKKLVIENDEKKQSEEAKKLKKEAEKISDKLNQHFEKFKNKIRIKQTKLADGNNGVAVASNSGEINEEGSLTIGEEIEALVSNELNILKSLNSKKDFNEKNKKDEKNLKNFEENNNEKKNAKKVNGGGNNKSSGGTKFKVDFANNGSENQRAKFVADKNTVFINLDHPYIKDLKKGDASKDVTKNLFFTKISHEIAYTEYAMGLVNLLYQKGYYGLETEEYLQEVREIINSLSSPIKDG